MKTEKLRHMARVTEAAYLHEFQKVQGILAEEARLRQNLLQLDAQACENTKVIARDTSMKSVGADLLWQAWLSRTRRQLHIELAQVMAQKLTAMDRVRNAFGRNNAVSVMHEKVENDRRSKLQKQALTRLIQGHVNQ